MPNQAIETASAHARKLPGPRALFRHKVRSPVTVTLTEAHHEKANRAAKRLGITRADLFGLLVEKYADIVEISQLP